MAEQKTQFEEDVRNLTPEQFARAEQIVSNVRRERDGGASDETAFRKKLAGMSNHELQHLWSQNGWK